MVWVRKDELTKKWLSFKQ